MATGNRILYGTGHAWLPGLAVLVLAAGCRTSPTTDIASMTPNQPIPEPVSRKKHTLAPCEPEAQRPARSVLVWHCSSDGLDPRLLSDLQTAARIYVERTGEAVEVNSGRRSLRHQAKLMADFSVGQLEGMYCRHGYPSYIHDIVDARQKAGRTLTSTETYDILSRRTEGYISSHLFGAAVDLAPPEKDVSLLKRLLEKHGFRVLDERSLGVQCIHATHTGVPTSIVRQ